MSGARGVVQDKGRMDRCCCQDLSAVTNGCCKDEASKTLENSDVVNHWCERVCVFHVPCLCALVTVGEGERKPVCIRTGVSLAEKMPNSDSGPSRWKSSGKLISGLFEGDRDESVCLITGEK